MTTQLSIVALPMGWLEVDKSDLTYGKDQGVKMWAPVWSAAILGAEVKIIVDTGMKDADWLQHTLGMKSRCGPGEGVEEALRTIGWRPEDVDIVINTHLHHDHMCGNHFFPRAKFVVQEREWLQSMEPLKTQAYGYVQPDIAAIDYFRWHFVNGTVDILPGIRVILTPGHSHGHQSVLVQTDAGCVALTGDATNLFENLQEEIPAGIHTSITESLQSIKLLRRIADYVLPGHEPAIAPFATNRDFLRFQRPASL